jgi:hypothetical protein
VGLRSGFRFNRGFAPEAAIGFASFGAQITRDERTTFHSRQTGATVPVHYTLDDRLRIAGVFLGTGASAWIPLRYDVGFLARVTAGMLFARASDPIIGTAKTDGDPVPITVSGRDEALPKVIGFVLPELGAEARFGALQVGFTIGAAFFPALGPRFKHENTGVSPRCEASDPTAVGCAPVTNLLAGERAYGAFMLWSPQISLGYAF